MNKIKNLYIVLIITVIVGLFLTLAVFPSFIKTANSFIDPSQVVTTAPVSTIIMAPGSLVSQNQASLHFQTGGKVAYLPFKEGDLVKSGQEIAGLDSLEAQKNVTAAEAAQRAAQSAKDLVIDNIHLFQYGNGGFANVGSANETQTQKTQRQTSEEAVNIAYDNLQKAKNQLTNTAIYAPFDGTIIHQDATNTGVNVTPAATFFLADMTKLVFQAQVSNNNISFIHEGDAVSIKLDGMQDKAFTGTILKIYPELIKLTSGGNGYKVDITSNDLVQNAKLGATGSVIIKEDGNQNIVSVPSWTVLGNKYIWVMESNLPKLKQVTVGDTLGGRTQILQGLTSTDQVILDPKFLVKTRYQII